MNHIDTCHCTAHRHSLLPLTRGAAIALLAVLGACSSDHPPRGSDDASARPTATAAARAALPDAVEVLRNEERAALKLANAAFQSDHIISPPGNNAMEHALQARQINPASAGAAEILTDIAPAVAVKVQTLISNGELAEAERVMDLLARSSPDSLTTLRLQRQLQAALPSNAVADGNRSVVNR